jgi:hypothetical protein
MSDPTTVSTDDKILALFREWVKTENAATAAVHSVDPEEYKAAEAAALEMADAIAAIPATGVIGLSIKAYLLVHNQDGHFCAAALRDEGDWSTVDKSVVRDIVRFVPELAPLVASVIENEPKYQNDRR